MISDTIVIYDSMFVFAPRTNYDNSERINTRHTSALLRRNVFVMLLIALSAQVSFAGNEKTFEFDLPRQALTQTLISIGKKSNVSIIFSSRALQGVDSRKLEGHYTIVQALDFILEDTDLIANSIDTKVISITPKEETCCAQCARVARPPTLLEELIIIGRHVTGSRLRHNDLHGTSPIDIVTAPEFDVSGAQNVGEFLKFVPAVSGNSTSTAVSNGGNGTATVTLRGLPANNTLVLINGKRTSPDGLGGDSVDLNTIPSAAIERIEILKDGASAIYGADAIAGVVNIILKKEHKGLQLESYYGETSRKDVDTKSNHVLWGKKADRHAFVVSVQNYKQEGLFSRDRILSANADVRNLGGTNRSSSAGENTLIAFSPDDIRVLDTSLQTENLGASIDDYRQVSHDDLFNYLSQTSSISPSKNHSLYISSSNQITRNLALTSQVGFTQNESQIVFASTPLTTANQIEDLTVSANNIYNPLGIDLTDVRRRILALPPRVQTNNSDSYRLNIDLDGSYESVFWNASLYWSKVYRAERFENLLNLQRTQRALGPSENCQGKSIDGCIPLNIFARPKQIPAEQLDYIRAFEFTKGTTKLYGAGVTFDSVLFSLPAGSVTLATGSGFRRETISIAPQFRSEGNPQANQEQLLPNEKSIAGRSYNPAKGTRSIFSMHIEMKAPILHLAPFAHSVDIEIAGRYSNYSDFGDQITRKAGMRYRPIPSLLLRGTYSEGFRVPSVGELSQGEHQSQVRLRDPCANEDNVGVLPGCTQLSDKTLNQFLTIYSSTPDLSSEMSTSTTIGVVWDPAILRGLYLSLDYFKISQENVTDQNAQNILNYNAKFGLFQDLVERDENGNIKKVRAPFLNIGKRDISGFDASLRYRPDTDKLENLSFTLNAAYLNNFDNQLSPESEVEHLAGTFADAASEGYGALPKWKANFGIYWARKRFEFSYSTNYIHNVMEFNPESEADRKVPSWTTHDIQTSYSFGQEKHFQLTFGIDNIFDTPPPFLSAAFNDNYDARTYDLKGRYFYTRLRFNY